MWTESYYYSYVLFLYASFLSFVHMYILFFVDVLTCFMLNAFKKLLFCIM